MVSASKIIFMTVLDRSILLRLSLVVWKSDHGEHTQSHSSRENSFCSATSHRRITSEQYVELRQVGDFKIISLSYHQAFYEVSGSYRAFDYSPPLLAVLTMIGPEAERSSIVTRSTGSLLHILVSRAVDRFGSLLAGIDNRARQDLKSSKFTTQPVQE